MDGEDEGQGAAARTGDAILYSSGALNTLYSINADTGDVMWSVGTGQPYADAPSPLRAVSRAGSPAKGLFYQATHLSKVGADQLMLFDTDWLNVTRPLKEYGGRGVVRKHEVHSRLVELAVDPGNRTARETWNFLPPITKYSNVLGSAQLLPGGHLFAMFTKVTAMMEVDRDKGRTHWEVTGERKKYTPNAWWIGRAEKFLERPLLKQVLPAGDLRMPSGKGGVVEYKVWNTYASRHRAQGKIFLTTPEGNSIVHKSFRFLPYWLPTVLRVPVTPQACGRHEYDIAVANEDDVVACASLTVVVQC